MRPRGRQPYRWPNAYFAEQGLFSLVTASAQERQILYEVNHQLESRMRENRRSGSVGGGATSSPYPYRDVRIVGFDGRVRKRSLLRCK
jgi:hypothetical protein